MIKLEIDEKFEELSNLYDLFENITRIDYVPLEYREEIKKSLIKAYKDGNQEFEKIHEKLKRLEQLEKENQKLKKDYNLLDTTMESDDRIICELLKENEKLKKAIKILKDKTNLKIEINAQNNPFITYDLWGSSAISKKEYDLLKEVLE